jgi:hypothetical protein
VPMEKMIEKNKMVKVLLVNEALAGSEMSTGC